MAVVDDPTAKQRTVQGKAGAYAGMKKYGDAANLPAGAMKKRGGASSPSPRSSRGRDERSSLLGWGEGQPSAAGAASVPSPLAGEGQGGGSTSRAGSKVHKPHLDEMHGPESLPYRPGRATSRKPSPDDTGPDSESRIFQPTSSREAALGRSTGG